MAELKKDFTKEFTAQKLKLRPWAILILATIVALVLVLPVLFVTLSFGMIFFTSYIALCIVVLLFSIPSVIKASRCPNCKKYLGRDISKLCPMCGVQIQF